MNSLDDLLSLAATRIDAEFELTQRSRLARMHEKIMRRVRRRRAAKMTSAIVLGVAAAVAISGTSISTSPDRRPSEDARRIAPAGVPSGGSTEGLGFWPNSTEERAASACASLLTDHRAVAAQFVGEFLGWSNSGERNIRRVGQDGIVKEQGRFPATFMGGPAPKDPWITLELSRIGGDRCWWVTGISDPENGATFTVSVKDQDLYAGWDMPERAERADLVVVDGDSEIREFVAGDAGATSAFIDDFTGPGFAVVLWKGADGTVFSAAGVTLPRGDHSATSP